MPDADSPLSGPAKVTIALRSPGFPRGRRPPPLPVQRVAFVNTGTAPITIAHITVDPVQDEQHGTIASPASLQVDMMDPPLAAIGAPFIVTLTGTAPARPGLYLSTVRLHPEAGSPVAVPVSISVSASPAWGVALTVLGLSIVNLMAGLDEQGTVASRLREALHKRAEAQIFVARYPEPEDRGDVPTMDRAYDAAIAALSRPRSAGLLDHRIEDATAPLAEADTLAASLKKAAAGLSPTDAVVASAAIPWQALQPQLHALSANDGRTIDETAPFSSRLDALLARLRDRLVAAPARWIEAELSAQITRLKLIAASGELDDARTQARAIQTAMRRAAHSLADGQRLVMRQGAQLAFLLGTVAEIQRGVSDPDIPARSRTDIVAKLDAAQAMLSAGDDFRRIVDVNRAVNDAETVLTLAASTAAQARVAAATAAASAETDLPAVDQATTAAQADPDRSPANKAAHLDAILAAWRSTIAQANDPASRPALVARVDAVKAALDRGDMPGVGAAYQNLTSAWAAYGERRVTLAGDRALKPYCDGYAARLQRQLGFIDQELRWEAPGARSVEWDRRRDRLRLAVERRAPDGDCLTVLLALDKELSGLTADIGATSADTAGIDAAVRLEALALYGVATANGPRALTPASTSDLYVDHPVTISVGNLDPAWRAGTTISIGFGDGSPPVRTDAETLRRTPAEHVYTRPLSAHVTALVTDGETAARPLGEGATTLLIAPAPDTQARKLADRFLSARFALALIVSLVIYSWRFQARDRIFGARTLDYAEAFALGFAVNAAISELPAALAKLPFG